MFRKCFLDNSKPQNFLHEKLKMFFFKNKKVSYGICKKCGLIYQSKTVKPKELNNYYENLTVALDNLHNPTKDKIKSTNRHINIIKDELKYFPNSVLEVGVFNKYNLKQFKKNGSKIINGIEPNKIVSQTVNKKANIKIYNGNIEKFKFKKKYDLIIMTHVLEHFYNPLLVLKKCYKNQKINQHVLLEVPLFESMDNYPNGSLHIEHLNYFNENKAIQHLFW